MSYRIRYEVRCKPYWKWLCCAGSVLWCVSALWGMWERAPAGEGLYDALARYVGGMILGPH